MRWDRAYQLAAWQTAYILSALGGKTIRPDELLGKAQAPMSDQEKYVMLLMSQGKSEAEAMAEAAAVAGAALSPTAKLERVLEGHFE